MKEIKVKPEVIKKILKQKNAVHYSKVTFTFKHDYDSALIETEHGYN